MKHDEFAEVSLDIEKLVHGGEGLARTAEGVVFVPFVLPGERVRAKLTHKRRGVRRAQLLEVVAPSDQRIAAVCPLFGRCGGCDMQHARYEEELRQKCIVFAETMRRNGGVEVTPEGITPSPAFAYRNRMRFHLDETGRLGFFERNSHNLVTVDRCPIAAPAINQYLKARRFTSTSKPGKAKKGRFTVCGTDSRGIDATGAREMAVKVRGKELLFPLHAFFQSNLSIVQKMVPYVVEGLSGRHFLDLYGGMGLYAAFLAETFQKGTLVETDKAAVNAARENTPSTRVVKQDIDAWVNQWKPDKTTDGVVVNPPRTGLSKAVRHFLTENAFPRLIYVSCDPPTMARDLAALTAETYKLDELRLFDAYPQTAHMEAVAKLSPQ